MALHSLYRVLSPLRIGGVIYRPGGPDQVELSEEQATALLNADYPIIEPLEPLGVEDQKSPPAQESLAPEIDFEPEPEPEVEALAKTESLIDLNTATLADIERVFSRVNGIGKGSAKAVFENGPYESLDTVPAQADLVGTAQAKWPEVAQFFTV